MSMDMRIDVCTKMLRLDRLPTRWRGPRRGIQHTARAAASPSRVHEPCFVARSLPAVCRQLWRHTVSLPAARLLERVPPCMRASASVRTSVCASVPCVCVSVGSVCIVSRPSAALHPPAAPSRRATSVAVCRVRFWCRRVRFSRIPRVRRVRCRRVRCRRVK